MVFDMDLDRIRMPIAVLYYFRIQVPLDQVEN